MINFNWKQENLTAYFKLWIVFFAYAAVVAFLLQLVVLPYIFPQWHAGNGLMIGGDSTYFHGLAVDLAKIIQSEGWSAWVLRPEGQAPAGIAAAIYALTVPQPWTIIPVYAALYATAGLGLVKILEIFVTDRRYAIWAALPFLLFPSAMNWYTQMLKDGFFIPGALMFLYGWMLLSQIRTFQKGWWPPLQAMLYIYLGTYLVAIVRPYGAQMMQGLAGIMGLMLTVMLVIRVVKLNFSWRRALIGFLMIWFTVGALTPYTRLGIFAEAPKTWVVANDSPNEQVGSPEPKSENPEPLSPGSAAQVPPSNNSEPTPGSVPGNEPQIQVEKSQNVFVKPMERIITAIANKAYTLAVTRDGFLRGYQDSKSNIDYDISFKSISDVINYMPRAAQIALFSPFPNQWFGQGKMGVNTVMRRISGVETVVVYISFPFLLYGVWFWRRRIEIWLALIFSCGMMVIYALVVPNIGALYRVRYAFIMTMVGLGIAAGIAYWQNSKVQPQKANMTSEM